MNNPNQYLRLVPARVCGYCGRPLSREHVEPGQQSVGVCLLCRTDADETKHDVQLNPAFPVLMVGGGGFWIVVGIWLARGMGWL